jgi:predicted enzyme related to lactoylglutathione lyase
MDASVLFAGIPVADFTEARRWYEQLFGRPPDVVAHDEEVMWQVAGSGWLYVLRAPERAGRSIVAIAVADIDETVASLAARGVPSGPVEPEGDAGRKAVLFDPAGNRVELLEIAGSS